jgi:hypothetical protein
MNSGDRVKTEEKRNEARPGDKILMEGLRQRVILGPGGSDSGPYEPYCGALISLIATAHNYKALIVYLV